MPAEKTVIAAARVPQGADSYARRWSLLDRDGVRHLPLRANDEDAWWTPIACGAGIVAPGPQSHNPVSCPACKQAATKAAGASA